MITLLLAFYRLVYIFWAGMMPAFFYVFINVRVITPAVWRNNH
ncbi:membrane protein [Escherichia coli]|nr:membrane protein [Escherichia coli]KIG50288.1 membrane protein [Escherichia coli]